MQRHLLDGHHERAVEVDVCAACQSMWFDGRESLQLTPGATLAVFRLIGERVQAPAATVLGPPSRDHAVAPKNPEERNWANDREIVKCPRCNGRLRRARDMQRATRFEYFRCPNEHGRLISFFDFLKEKDFVKPLSPLQIAELRKNVLSVNCSNCAAPVDLAKGTDCGHCGSPLSMLDLNQAERLIEQLTDAGRPGTPVDPALPLALARARRETDIAFRGLPGHEDWDADTWSLGLVGAGLTRLFRRLKN